MTKYKTHIGCRKGEEVGTFAVEIQTTNAMIEKKYKRFSDYSLEMMSQDDPNMTVLRGKGLLNQQENRFIFVQNPPRGPRSVEVGRTAHSRTVRRPDGFYTVTFRFDSGEKQILAALLAEVRAVVKNAQADKRAHVVHVTKYERDRE